MNASMEAMIGCINAKYVKEEPFSAMMVNHYKDFNSRIGLHGDTEVLDHEDVGGIAFSIGQFRDLIFRESDIVRKTKGKPQKSNSSGRIDRQTQANQSQGGFLWCKNQPDQNRDRTRTVFDRVWKKSSRRWLCVATKV